MVFWVDEWTKALKRKPGVKEAAEAKSAADIKLLTLIGMPVTAKLFHEILSSCFSMRAGNWVAVLLVDLGTDFKEINGARQGMNRLISPK